MYRLGLVLCFALVGCAAGDKKVAEPARYLATEKDNKSILKDAPGMCRLQNATGTFRESCNECREEYRDCLLPGCMVIYCVCNINFSHAQGTSIGNL